MNLTRGLSVPMVLLLLSGCSLLFTGEGYEREPMDGGEGDAGVVTCRSHEDCRSLNDDRYYVCVPRGADRALICAADCQAAADCSGLGGHDEGVLCSSETGDRGCGTGDANCADSRYPVCVDGQCQPPPCMNANDCGAGTACFLGLCQNVPCNAPDDCVEPPARTAACVDSWGGQVCADHCDNGDDCASGTCRPVMRVCTTP